MSYERSIIYFFAWTFHSSFGIITKVRNNFAWTFVYCWPSFKPVLETSSSIKFATIYVTELSVYKKCLEEIYCKQTYLSKILSWNLNCLKLAISCKSNSYSRPVFVLNICEKSIAWWTLQKVKQTDRGLIVASLSNFSNNGEANTGYESIVLWRSVSKSYWIAISSELFWLNEAYSS